jgi:threonine synthase
MAIAISRAVELGIAEVALPSAGNAGGAAAAYAARAGLRCHVAMPHDAPKVNRREAKSYGAKVTLVDGLIDLAGVRIRKLARTEGWFDLSTLREPYRTEGKKTMGYELAEGGGWNDSWCPDVLVFPTGGGTGIVGMWKAFAELEALGWIGRRRPRMVVVQAEGCAPLVRAFENGASRAEPWVDAKTVAAGIRVPSSIGDYLVLEAVRASGGTAISVTDDEMLATRGQLARQAGISVGLEGAAAFAALPHLTGSGVASRTDRVIVFNTAMGIKS